MGQFSILVLHQPLHLSHRYLFLRFMGLVLSHAPRSLHLRLRSLQIFSVTGNRRGWRRVTRTSTATHAVTLHAPVAHVAMTHIMATFDLLHLPQPSPYIDVYRRWSRRRHRVEERMRDFFFLG
ncbi:hypothetical protein PHAVU_002G179800 [Phaseolus vulgaris]|uniref:Uncharacterized protein n=1 Tax=Phaseolus vulgaris TaxID=3885 RepID=V7CKQ1_PHAVU|nr:hypothetical protein PHAVU_002G179800g [Phaseolus vulgaris]ESW30757.1 hypothetical protein PHAVU_002G179800g [Phaseolus vulgaris]